MNTTMAGKGPQIRKGANLKSYWDHYDDIFRKSKPVANRTESDEHNTCSPQLQTTRNQPDCESSTEKRA